MSDQRVNLVLKIGTEPEAIRRLAQVAEDAHAGFVIRDFQLVLHQVLADLVINVVGYSNELKVVAE